jgi:hypothetical protein
MSLSSLVVIYFCCWWLIFLPSLSVGEGDRDLAEKSSDELAANSLSRRLMQKALIVTLVSFPLTFFIVWLLSSGKLIFLLK